MDKNAERKIDKLINNLNADGYDEGDPWGGHALVLIPRYDEEEGEIAYVGLPFVIFVDGSSVRLSTAKESLDYLAATGEEPEEE